MKHQDTKQVKKAIVKVRQELKWAIVNRPSTSGHYQIVCQPDEQVHYVLVPAHSQNRLEYLHELGHAWLCEKADQSFGNSIFKENTPAEWINAVAQVFLTAQDWFVNAWLTKRCAQAQEADILYHVRLFEKLMRSGVVDRQFFLGIAMTLAEQEHLLRNPVPAALRNHPELKERADVFLTVDPYKPQPANLAKLVNALLSLEKWGKVTLVNGIWVRD